jgi:hypothetical protein
MRYLKWYGSFILALMLLASRIPLHAAEIEVAVGAWQQNPRGSVSYTYNVLDIATKTADGIVHDLVPFDNHLIKQLHNDMEDLIGTLFPGTDANGVIDKIFTRTDTLDFDDDAYYDPIVRPTGRVKIMVSPFLNFYLMATPIEFEGSGEKALNFTFLGVTFTSNVPFESRLKLTHYDFAYYIDIPDFSAGQAWEFHTDAGLNLRIVDFYAEISQGNTGLAASAEYTVPLPMLYLAAQLKNKGGFSIEAETRGVRYSSDYTYSLIGRVKFHIYKSLHLAAGYRLDYITFSVHDIDSEGTFSGPFMETVLIF